jgi:hypothetical protein
VGGKNNRDNENYANEIISSSLRPFIQLDELVFNQITQQLFSNLHL